MNNIISVNVAENEEGLWNLSLCGKDGSVWNLMMGLNDKDTALTCAKAFSEWSGVSVTLIGEAVRQEGDAHLGSLYNSVKLGSKVYYKDNGPDDVGVVVDIVLGNAPFVVKWEKQKKSEFIEVEFFGVKIERNLADENIDSYTGDQLVLVEY